MTNSKTLTKDIKIAPITMEPFMVITFIALVTTMPILLYYIHTLLPTIGLIIYILIWSLFFLAYLNYNFARRTYVKISANKISFVYRQKAIEIQLSQINDIKLQFIAKKRMGLFKGDVCLALNIDQNILSKIKPYPKYTFIRTKNDIINYMGDEFFDIYINLSTINKKDFFNMIDHFKISPKSTKPLIDTDSPEVYNNFIEGNKENSIQE